MINFATKLDGALSLLEMAQLAKRDFTPAVPEHIGWIAKWGVDDKVAEEHYGKQDKADVIDYVNDKLKSDYGNANPEDLDDMFGVKSFDELMRSITIKKLMSTVNSYTERDIKALSNQKTWDKIAELLSSGPGNYTWNIFAIDRNVLNSGRYDAYSGIKPYLKDMYPDIDLANSITFVKRDSSGDALDADMVIHTAGHAVASLPGNGKLSVIILQKLDTIVKQIRQLVETAQQTNNWDALGVDKAKVESLQKWSGADTIISQFLHFNAAKNTIRGQDISLSSKRQVGFAKRGFGGAMDEALHEMISVFIKRDRVRFEPNEFCYIAHPKILQQVAETKDLINSTLRVMLDKCVGQIITD